MRRIAIEAPIASAHNSVPCTPDADVASPSSPSAAFRYAADKVYKKIAWQVKNEPYNGVTTQMHRSIFALFFLSIGDIKHTNIRLQLWSFQTVKPPTKKKAWKLLLSKSRFSCTKIKRFQILKYDTPGQRGSTSS